MVEWLVGVSPPARKGLAELIHPDSSACPADVADHHAADALNVLRQMLGNDARLDVRRAACGVIDDHGDDLPGELLGKSGVAQGKQDN